MSLIDLVNAALDQALTTTYHEARKGALRAACIAEAERLRLTGVPVRELTSDQGLGFLRLDGAGRPAAPTVEDPAALASWLAEHHPHLVHAAITVPVDRLAEALEVLGYAGLAAPAVTAAVESRDPQATAVWLADNCRVQADPDRPGAWNVLHADADGKLTPVPGTSAYQPVPSWKLTADPGRKAWNVAAGATEVEEQVHLLRTHPSPEEYAEDLAAIAGPEATDTVEEQTCPHGTPLTDPHCQGCDNLRDGMEALTPGELAADLADAAVEDGYDGPMPDDARVTPDMPRALLADRARDLALSTAGAKADLVHRINSYLEVIDRAEAAAAARAPGAAG